MKSKACSQFPCDAKVVARGLCNRHYIQISSAGKIGEHKRERRCQETGIDELRVELLSHRKNEVTESGCVVWNGSRDRRGYAQVRYKRRLFYVSRIMLGLHNGPHEIHACHRCDNPPCINPDHLFQGSRKDNAADMMRKGRGGGQFKKLGRTECPRGHKYVIVNGRQKCRVCDAAYAAKKRMALHASA